jgi:hypothetical protein
VADGDGDLADNALDMLTLTAVGNYKGAKHTVRAVVPPFKRALMIVPDPASLTLEDNERLRLLRNWGWKVRLLKADAQKAEFDAAIADVHAIYLPSHTDLAPSLKNEFKTCDLPIISGHAGIAKEIGLATNVSVSYEDSSIDVPELTRTITDNAGVPSTEVYKHYITSPFAVGQLRICSAPDRLLYLVGRAAGADALATAVGSPGQVVLAALEYGALKTDDTQAPARRVALPWGDEGLNFSALSLNDSGREILKRSLDWASSGWRGPLPGIATWRKIEVAGLGRVDGFNSILGPYGGGNVNADATLSCNSLEDNTIYINGGIVQGTVFIMPQADIGKVVTVGNGGTVLGGTRRLSLEVPMPLTREPLNMPASLGDQTFSTGIVAPNNDLHYNNLTLMGDVTLQIKCPVRILCDGDAIIKGNAQITLEPGGKLLMCTKGVARVRDAAQVNVNTADPGRLNWLILNDTVRLIDTAQVYAAVQGFDGVLAVRGSAHFYGTFLGKKVSVDESGAFHVDTALSGTPATLGGGLDLKTIAGSGVRWIESP